jgi:hypothetical protein
MSKQEEFVKRDEKKTHRLLAHHRSKVVAVRKIARERTVAECALFSPSLASECRFGASRDE